MFGNRPVIGICPLYDEKRESYWMLPGYMKMLEAQGAIPMMLPLTTEPGELDYFLESCDGFILTGGHDVSPAVYEQETTDLCGYLVPERDAMDAYILKGAIVRDKAVLGICRGHQLMNAALGGTLYQDVVTQFGHRVNHRMQPPYDGVEHLVDLIPGTPLALVQGTAAMGVNSCHHQAIRDLAPGLKAQAVAADGIVEAVYMPDKRFVWGVQWHPEFAWKVSEPNRKIVAAFLQAAKGEGFYPVDDLTDGEIFLHLTRTGDAQPEKRWLPAYYFDICLMDGTRVGFCDLRIGHNDKTYVGGNIGYGVDEPYRGHRYAAKACKLLQRQAKKHGMTHLFISCMPENLASARTIELAGLRYLETIAIPEDNEMYAEGKRFVKIHRIDLEA